MTNNLLQKLKELAINEEVSIVDGGYAMDVYIEEMYRYVERKHIFRINADGLRVRLSELRAMMQEEGYYPYISRVKDKYSNTPAEITVVPIQSQFDILDRQKTEAPNYNIDTTDIIEQLKKWDSKYGIELIGAGNDWVHFALKSMPKSISAFIKEEVFPFCPDFIYQSNFGHLPVEKAVKQIAPIFKNNKPIFLWWD